MQLSFNERICEIYRKSLKKFVGRLGTLFYFMNKSEKEYSRKGGDAGLRHSELTCLWSAAFACSALI